MKNMTVEKALRILQKFEDRFGPDTRLMIQYGNGCDEPSFEIAVDEFGIKFIFVC